MISAVSFLWRLKTGLMAVVACVAMVALTECTAVAHDGGEHVLVRGTIGCSISAGHGRGDAGLERHACPAIADAEGSVDEIEVRDAPSRTATAKGHVHRPDFRLPGRDHADVALDQSALVANAANLSRLCRRLL